MIYVSSSCVKAEFIADAVEQLVKHGFRNIELSGGTKYYHELEDDLLVLKEEHGLNYLCHNYFPPPADDFVLNLASLDDEVSRKSLEHILKALDLSNKLGADKYAFHAGFLISIPVNELGKPIQKRQLFDRNKAKQRFEENYTKLSKAANGISLYVENNVLSQPNFENYGKKNPFFITHSGGLNEFKDIDIMPLLDVAHLKVSCQTLQLDFREEFHFFMDRTDYIHISDNDGKTDNNKGIKGDSEILSLLSDTELNDKTITLEVYDGMESLTKSYELITELKSD